MARNTIEGMEATRKSLLDAARALFAQRGYADTATPDIVALAKVTRGALYHHFDDKRALFLAVAEREAARVAEEIEARAAPASSPREALLKGASAYFDAMAVEGRTRLLLVEAPAVLGGGATDAVDAEHAERSLRLGLADLLAGSGRESLLEPLTPLMSAAFDRASLAIDAGGNRKDYEAAIAALIDGLGASPSR